MERKRRQRRRGLAQLIGILCVAVSLVTVGVWSADTDRFRLIDDITGVPYYSGTELQFHGTSKFIRVVPATNVGLRIREIDDDAAAIDLRATATGGNAIYYIGGLGTHFIDAEGEVRFNELGNDIDFRIEGNGEADLFFVDAGNDRIGILTLLPKANLHVLGSGSTIPSISASTVGLFSSTLSTGNDAYVSILSGSAANARLNLGDHLTEIMGGLDYDNNLDSLGLVANGSVAVTIDNAGNGGFGVIDPAEKVEIDGNLLFHKETDRQIKVEDTTTASTIGAALSIEAGDGTNDLGGGAVNIDPGTAPGLGVPGSVNIGSINTPFGINLYGIVAIPITSAVALTIGGDAVWYRSAANVMRTPDSLVVDGQLAIGATTPATILHLKDNAPVITADAENTASGLRLNSLNLASAASPAFRFQADGVDRMEIERDGDVGIGTNAPGRPLEVEEASAPPVRFDRTGSDGVIVELQGQSVTEGTISVSGTTVSYNGFTGSHHGVAKENILPLMRRGVVAVMTGANDRTHGEIAYGIAPSTSLNQSSVLGSVLGRLEPSPGWEVLERAQRLAQFRDDQAEALGEVEISPAEALFDEPLTTTTLLLVIDLDPVFDPDTGQFEDRITTRTERRTHILFNDDGTTRTRRALRAGVRIDRRDRKLFRRAVSEDITEDLPADQEPFNPILVASVGNGDMRVFDAGLGNVEPGDPLVTSTELGHGQLIPNTISGMVHVIARAGEPIDWATMRADGDGEKKTTISVLFDRFVFIQ